MRQSVELKELKALENALIAKLPFHKQNIHGSFADMDDELKRFLLQFTELYADMGVSVADLADAYALLMKATMKEQVFFAKNKHYRYSTYEEVRRLVYDNADFMEKYMIGLGLSTALWPNHRAIYSFFKNFVNDNNSRGGYLEVGAGHGFFCSVALKKDAWRFYDVVDISETSINLSRKALGEFEETRNLRFIHGDFLDLDETAETKYDTIVMGEVLEHVEAPLSFIEKCRRILSPEGRVYVSTCLNAPEPDHIYLFTRLQDVVNLFCTGGMAVEEYMYVPYEAHTLEECEEKMLPINVAYILKPR